jgi:hypothetical protein
LAISLGAAASIVAKLLSRDEARRMAAKASEMSCNDGPRLAL